jgi:hypothetical protein
MPAFCSQKNGGRDARLFDSTAELLIGKDVNARAEARA